MLLGLQFFLVSSDKSAHRSRRVDMDCCLRSFGVLVRALRPPGAEAVTVLPVTESPVPGGGPTGCNRGRFLSRACPCGVLCPGHGAECLSQSVVG